MPILNLPDTIEIPFETLTNEQRKAIHTVMTGRGLRNPMAEKIQTCREACLSEIEAFNGLSLAVLDGEGNCPSCSGSECFFLSAQQRQDIIYLLELLIYWLDALEVHTNKLSGSEVGSIDQFFQRLSTAGSYTSALKTITGLNHEKFSMVFRSLMGAGDVCLDRMLNPCSGDCQDGYTTCGSNIAANSGVVGLVGCVCNTANADAVISCFINQFIGCVKDLIEEDNLNYCEAKKVVDKYAASSRLTKDAIADPIIGQIVRSIFATPELKQALLDIKQDEVSEEVLQKTEQFFPEFTDESGRVTDCEGSPFVVVGPVGEQGLPGIDGCRGPVGPPGAPGLDGDCDGTCVGGITGACCVSGFCLEITDSQCAFYNGQYYGDESECNVEGGSCVPPHCGSDNECLGEQVCCGTQCTDPCPDRAGGEPPCNICPPCAECDDCSPSCGGNCCADDETCCGTDCMPTCEGGGCPNCQGGCCPPDTVCCGGDGCCPPDRCCGGACCPPDKICCGGYCTVPGACGTCDPTPCCDEDGNPVDPCDFGNIGDCPNYDCNNGCGCTLEEPHCCNDACYAEPHEPCGGGCCPTDEFHKCCFDNCCDGPFNGPSGNDCCVGGCPCTDGTMCCPNDGGCVVPCEINGIFKCPCTGDCCSGTCSCADLNMQCCDGVCCDGACCGPNNDCCGEGDFSGLPCCVEGVCTGTCIGGGCPCGSAGCCNNDEHCCDDSDCCGPLTYDSDTDTYSGTWCCPTTEDENGPHACRDVCPETGDCPCFLESCCGHYSGPGGCECGEGGSCCEGSSAGCCNEELQDENAGVCIQQAGEDFLGGCCEEDSLTGCCPDDEKCCSDGCQNACYGHLNPGTLILDCFEDPTCGTNTHITIGQQGACPGTCSGGTHQQYEGEHLLRGDCCSALGGDCCSSISGLEDSYICIKSPSGWDPEGTDYMASQCCPPGMSCCGDGCTNWTQGIYMEGCDHGSSDDLGGGPPNSCYFGEVTDSLQCCVDGQQVCGGCGCCNMNDFICREFTTCGICQYPCSADQYVAAGTVEEVTGPGGDVVSLTFEPCEMELDENDNPIGCLDGPCNPMGQDHWHYTGSTAFAGYPQPIDDMTALQACIFFEDGAEACVTQMMVWGANAGCCITNNTQSDEECSGNAACESQCVDRFCGIPDYDEFPETGCDPDWCNPQGVPGTECPACVVDGVGAPSENMWCQLPIPDSCAGAVGPGVVPSPGYGGIDAIYPIEPKGACCYMKKVEDDNDPGSPFSPASHEVTCTETTREHCLQRLYGFHFAAGKECSTGGPSEGDKVDCETVPRNLPGGGGIPPAITPNNPENPCQDGIDFCVDAEGNGVCCKDGQICCGGECKSGGRLNNCCYSEITKNYYHCPHGCCQSLDLLGNVVCKNADSDSNCPTENRSKAQSVKSYQRAYTGNKTFSKQDVVIEKNFDNQGRLSNYTVSKPVIGRQDELSVQLTLTDAPTTITTKPQQVITAPIQFQIVNFVADDKIKTKDRPSHLLAASTDSKSRISEGELRTSSNIGQAAFEGHGTKAQTIKGSVTANIGSGGILGESQVITFVSGSNIRLATNEESNIIQINVDDFNLWELVDVGDGVSGATSGDILQYSSLTKKWELATVPVGPTGPTGPVAGTDKQILYNLNGLGASGSPNLTYDYTTNTLGITASVELNKGFTAGGICYFQDNELDQIKLKDYSETVYAVGNVNSSTAFNLENGNVQTVTVAGTDTGSQIVFSFSNPPATGNAGSVTLIMTNPMAHGDVAWHSSVKWSGATAPSLSSSGTDIVSFTTLDAGTTWYGFVGGIGFS